MTMQVGPPPNNAQSPISPLQGTGALSNMPIQGPLGDKVAKAGLEPPEAFKRGVMGGSVSSDLSKKADEIIGSYSLQFGGTNVAGETDGPLNATKELIPSKSAFESLGGNKGRNDQGPGM